MTGLLSGYALFRTEVLNASPSVRQAGVQPALDDVSQAVVLLDDEERRTELRTTSERRPGKAEY